MDGSRSKFAMMQYDVGSTKHKIESPQLLRTRLQRPRANALTFISNLRIPQREGLSLNLSCSRACRSIPVALAGSIGPIRHREPVSATPYSPSGVPRCSPL
jgi:hypothetical protein